MLEAALVCHREGRLSQAKMLYEEILQANPNHFDALHHSGMIARRRHALNDAADFFERAARIRGDFAPLCASQGLLSHDLRRFYQAFAFYDRAISLMPQFTLAYYNKGVTLEHLRRFEGALACYDRAVAIQPDYADGHNNRGNCLKELRRLDEALASYERAISINPHYASAFNNRGVTLKDMGRFQEALANYEKALVINPEDIAAHNNRGIALQHLKRPSEALTSFDRAVFFNPGFALAHYNRGVVLEECRRFDDALASFDKAIVLNPSYADAYNNRGNALKALRRLEGARIAYRVAIVVKPDHAGFYSNCGVVLQELKRFDEALSCFTHAILLDPGHAGAYSNSGVALKEARMFDEAIAFYDKAISIKPDYAEAFNNRGVALQDLKRFDEAMESFQKAISLDSENFHAHSNLLFTMNYVESLGAEARLQEALLFGASVSRSARHPFRSWNATAGGHRLKIGFVSGDFRNHPVGYFLEGFLSKIDQTRFELFAYSCLPVEDELTRRLTRHIPVWRPLWDKSDSDAAKLIHADGLHILIDLAGHTANNRLSVFAHKPAPVQASWLGYFATTGVAEIDFLVGDPQVVPTGEEGHFCECIMRLPETYFCFSPPQVSVEVGELPALKNGYVTFGCFNNLAKMSGRVVALWAEVLRAVEGSRLFLKSAQLGDPAIVESTREMFRAAGVAADRLLVEGPSNRNDYFEAFHRVDIALDPFPFPGGTTSVEGLWMGVPVITLRGDRFIAHNGETIAHNSGQAAWIAKDEEDYIRKAVLFSSDLSALAKLRSGLRMQVLGSPLFDAERFARHFETLLMDMWGDYIDRSSSANG